MTAATLDDPEAILLDPGRHARTVRLPLAKDAGDGPLISCIMPTRGRIVPARHAIDCFLRQTYGNRELVIACTDAGDGVRDHVAAIGDARIRFIGTAGPPHAGLLRNRAIAEADGSYVCIWDDDDLSDPGRLDRQFAALCAAGARACFLSRTLLWWPARRRIAVSSRRVWENTMLAERAAMPLYEGSDRGNDTALARTLRATVRMVLIDAPCTYCYIAHGANVWSSDHFEMLFANASEQSEPWAYDATVAALGQAMPLGPYAADLAALTSAG